MSDTKHYIAVNKSTGELELNEFPYPEKEKELMDEIYQEFAFEPLDRATLEKMNRFIEKKLEVMA